MNSSRIIVSISSLGIEGDFDFTISGGLEPSTFSVPATGSKVFKDVPYGTYTVTQLPKAKTVLDNMFCSPGTTDLPNSSWTFTIDSATTATGVFVNSVERGTLIIEKQVIGPSVGDITFAFNVDGGPTPQAPFVIVSGEGSYQTYASLLPGSYTVSEVQLLNFEQTSLTIEGQDTNQFSITSGEQVNCKIVNIQKSELTLMVIAPGEEHTEYFFASNVEDYSSFSIKTRPSIDGNSVGAATLGLIDPRQYEIQFQKSVPEGWKIDKVEGTGCYLEGWTIIADLKPGFTMCKVYTYKAQ